MAKPSAQFEKRPGAALESSMALLAGLSQNIEAFITALHAREQNATLDPMCFASADISR